MCHVPVPSGVRPYVFFCFGSSPSPASAAVPLGVPSGPGAADVAGRGDAASRVPWRRRSSVLPGEEGGVAASPMMSTPIDKRGRGCQGEDEWDVGGSSSPRRVHLHPEAIASSCQVELASAILFSPQGSAGRLAGSSRIELCLPDVTGLFLPASQSSTKPPVGCHMLWTLIPRAERQGPPCSPRPDKVTPRISRQGTFRQNKTTSRSSGLFPQPGPVRRQRHKGPPPSSAVFATLV